MQLDYRKANTAGTSLSITSTLCVCGGLGEVQREINISLLISRGYIWKISCDVNFHC